MAIHTWTVDDPDTLRQLADAGVDAVYTRRRTVSTRCPTSSRRADGSVGDALVTWTRS